jgi:hypothetical protein
MRVVDLTTQGLLDLSGYDHWEGFFKIEEWVLKPTLLINRERSIGDVCSLVCETTILLLIC